MPDACTDAHVYLPDISNFTNSSSTMQCAQETLKSGKQWQRSQAKENVLVNNYLFVFTFVIFPVQNEKNIFLSTNKI